MTGREAGTPGRQQLQVAAAGGRRGPDRGTDRRLAFGGVAVSAALLFASLASLALPDAARLGTWLPLHLALAGAASTAIAAMLPFFTAALAVAPPADPRVRGLGVLLVPVSALAVTLGRVAGIDELAALGGAGFAAGMLAVAAAAALPLRRSLGPRRRIVEAAYAVALLEVALGAAIAALFLGGDVGIAARWTWLKPAHAWLNLLGFVSLVIGATLVHLGPTVVGARIRPRASARLAVAGLGAGPAVAALGYALASDGVAAAGAAITLAGAAALAWHGFAIRAGRFAWTSDDAWHRMSEWSLAIGPLWLAVAVAIATAQILASGANAAGWTLLPVLAPLVPGYVVQVLVGAWTHLVPAIGPGDPVRHASQRDVLGTASTARLALWNAGVAGLTVAVLLPEGATSAAGAIASTLQGALLPGAALLLAGTLAGSLALLVRAVAPVRAERGA